MNGKSTAMKQVLTGNVLKESYCLMLCTHPGLAQKKPGFLQCTVTSSVQSNLNWKKLVVLEYVVIAFDPKMCFWSKL